MKEGISDNSDSQKDKNFVNKKCVCLGDFLPSVPKIARKFLSTRYNENDISLNSQIY